MRYANSSPFDSVIGWLYFFMGLSASYGGLTLPFASGIIDDLIVKAKVFGASTRQFLVSFFENFRVTKGGLRGGSLIVENPSIYLHLSGAVIINTRACGAFILNSFNVINVLCKSIVKYVAIFYYGRLVVVLRGFLFVFPEANLYNAARLAGRVSFKVILK